MAVDVNLEEFSWEYLHMNKLISRLRVYGTGCQLGRVLMCIFVNADDIILLASNRNGLQTMVNVWEQFVNLFSIRN